MIRRLIGKVFGRRGSRTRQNLTTYTGKELGLEPRDISSAAMRTCQGLHKAGFEAYVVGGGVRDALVGKKPKDFDVATNATPEEVNRIFRRSRLIGRRFQIVHVIFGRETIEVSTFRARQTNAETDDHGRVLRDNVWGSKAEDAMRRDFTINALYYDPVADSVLDYHNGIKDLRKKTIRMIGDPATRYREDPVRLLRVARFAAKLEFEIETATRAPMKELAPLISNVPNARLFDEMLKLLMSGHALNCLHELRDAGLHHGLMPMLDVILEQPDGETFIATALSRTDERIADGKSVSPGFLFATLLWQIVNERWQKNLAEGEHRIPALMQAIDSVLEAQAGKLAIQKRFASDMREIWSLQPRFERRNGQAPFRLLEHMRFRAAYDFLLLCCETGGTPAELGEWWTEFQDADTSRRQEMADSAPRAGGTKRRSRSRRRRKPSRAPNMANPDALQSAAHELQSKPPGSNRSNDNAS